MPHNIIELKHEKQISNFSVYEETKDLHKALFIEFDCIVNEPLIDPLQKAQVATDLAREMNIALDRLERLEERLQENEETEYISPNC